LAGETYNSTDTIREMLIRYRLNCASFLNPFQISFRVVAIRILGTMMGMKENAQCAAHSKVSASWIVNLEVCREHTIAFYHVTLRHPPSISLATYPTKPIHPLLSTYLILLQESPSAFDPLATLYHRIVS
jgi:hypothetical protein